MRIRRLSLSLLVFLFPSATCWSSDYGDVVKLKNGDRLTGRIVSMQKKEILIETSYAGKCHVKVEHVKCISSENDLTIKMADKQVIIGRARCSKDGLLQIENDRTGTTKAFSISDVSEINPAPPVTYKAIFNAGGSRASGNTNTTNVNLSGNFQARSERNRFIIRRFEVAGVESAYKNGHQTRQSRITTSQIFPVGKSFIRLPAFPILSTGLLVGFLEQLRVRG